MLTPVADNNFRLLLRVRYSECDAQGVVFNARYADYVDHAITEFQRYLLGGYQTLTAQNLENQVVKLTLEWSSAAAFDDVLAIDAHVQRIGNTSYSFAVDIKQQESGQLVAQSEAIYVLVDAEHFKKTPVPDDMRAKMQASFPGVQVDQSGGLLNNA